MKQRYTMPTKVEFAQTNFDLKLKLYELVNKMQESSSLHGEKLGMGYEALEANNLGWIISRYRIEIDQYPEFEDEIFIETWASGLERIMAMRNFDIYNKNKEKIASIYCMYILIDSQTGKIQRIDKLPVKLETIENQSQDENLKKINIKANKELLVNSYERKVHYTDIDVNMHMNNSCYVQWIEDAFPLEKHREMEISKIQVNFISGARLDEEIIIKVYKIENLENIYHVQGKAKKDSRDIFQAKVKWK